MSEEAKTLTGIPLHDVAEKLNEVLDPAAYKVLPHRSYLTDINPAYLREVATEVFGLCGYGWFYDYSADNVLLTPTQDAKGKPESYDATIKHFWLRYRYLDEDGVTRMSERIPSAGGSKNSAREEALKGAITNCLGKAFSMLCWQLDVYKGLRGPDGKTKKKAAAKKKTAPGIDWANHIGKEELEILIANRILPPDSHEQHVVNLFKLSPFKPGDDYFAEGRNLGWWKHYRGNRDQDMKAKQAAAAATKAYKA